MASPSRADPYFSSSPAPPAGHKVRQVWTPEEDRLLIEAVAKERPKDGPISWHKIASHLPGRNNKDCRKRWHYSIANTIRKGPWTREEDERLREAVELYGTRWSKIAEAVGTRNGDQCWKRWYDCLDPRIDKSPWSPEDDAKLLHLVSIHGRNWSDIVHRHFPNRTSLAAKNRYSILRRKQEGNGGSNSSSSSSSSSSRSRSSSTRRTTNGNSSSSSSRPVSGVMATPSPTPTPAPGSSSPFLCVPTPPSGGTASPLSTPEPELLTPEDWTWLGLNEFLGSQHQHNQQQQQVDAASAIATAGGAWSPAENMSATPSPYMQHLDLEPQDFGSDSWMAGDLTAAAAAAAAAAATSQYMFPQTQTQTQTQTVVHHEHAAHDALNMYSGHHHHVHHGGQVPRLEMHDVSGRVMTMMNGSPGMNSTAVPLWQDGFTMGAW